MTDTPAVVLELKKILPTIVTAPTSLPNVPDRYEGRRTAETPAAQTTFATDESTSTENHHVTVKKERSVHEEQPELVSAGKKRADPPRKIVRRPLIKS